MSADGNTAAKPLVLGDFADKIGDAFVIRDEGAPSVALTLREAQALDPRMAPRGVRPPFSLMFLAARPLILPQRIYRMEHDRLGEVAIFLVPVGKDAEGVHYQAVFN
jgi:hypothetical protein